MDEKTQIILKPDDSTIKNVDFKQEVIMQLKKTRDIIACFDNEPSNINMMADTLPKAYAVFYDIRYADKKVVPYSSLPWIQDFYLESNL